MINANTIPEELREVPQWVCWKTKERDGKATKVPVNPRTDAFASVRDSQSWTSFEEAVETVTTNDSVSGVGFVFTEDDPFVGVDLDDCRDAESGKPEPWARALIEQLDSFSEVSPSGTGFHIYAQGELPDGGNRSGGIECYEAARFFTVTGEWVAGTPMAIHERSAALADIHAEHIAEPDPVGAETTATTEPSTAALDDDELLSKATNAKNGPKFTRLWNGDTSGYDSHSEADMALCFLLAFWTGRGAAQMDRLFRRSGLFREKWDERHYADGRTYGEGTVERAIRETSDVYEPSGNDREGRTTNEGSELVTPPASTTEESADPVHLTVLDRVSELETTVVGLSAELKALEAQHEFLYESIQTEQKQHERTQRRLRRLESVVEENQRPWFSQLF